MTDDRVVVITGTRKGVGRGLAVHYLEAGWVVIGASRGPASIDLERYDHFCLDVADERAVKHMFTEIRRRYGRVDALVNNAGIARMNHSLLTPVETVRRIVETNFTGTFLCCREAAKIMQRRRTGRIVNVASVAVPLALEGEAAYAASKAGVVTFSRVLARELAPHGITVNIVGPGPVKTEMTSSLSEAQVQHLLERLPIPRFTEFGEIAHVIDFFLHEESDSVTGQVIYLGGV